MNKPVRRVVTGHDEDGKAVGVCDGAAPNAKRRQGGIVSTLLWVTDEGPAYISGGSDRAQRTIGVPPPPGGTIFRVVHFPAVDAAVRTIDNAAYVREMGIETAPGTPAGHAHTHPTKRSNPPIV